MDHRQMMRLASTPVTLVILLGLLAAGVLWGYKAVTAKVTGPPPPACVTMPMPTLTTASVTVNIYNGGTSSGLAGRVADKLRAGGYLIGTVSNTTDNVLTVIIIGAATDNPEVQLVAGWFTDPVIVADNRPDHTVDVLVGDGYDEQAVMTADPPASIDIPSGQVCLPASETPTPDATEPDSTDAQPTDEPT